MGRGPGLELRVKGAKGCESLGLRSCADPGSGGSAVLGPEAGCMWGEGEGGGEGGPSPA